MGKRIKNIEKTVDLGMEKPYVVNIPSEIGIAISKLNNVGKRKSQQDSFGISDFDEDTVQQKGILAVVADGMGGLSGGERASMATVISALNYFDTNEMENIPVKLREMIENANEQVKEVVGITKGQSGSTIVCVHIMDHQMFFASVGDSRILLIRDGEIFQLNKEHNYEADLLEMVQDGRMTMEEALQDPQKDALTSYIGIDYLERIDQNLTEIELFEGDRILLITDGVYNTLSDAEILSSMEYSAGRAMMHIEMQIEAKNRPNQDNYTAVLIEIKE